MTTLKFYYYYPNLWELAQSLTYKGLTVPIGFISDLASIPRPFRVFWAPYGRYIRASIIHDYLWAHPDYSKQDANDIFLEVMIEDNVSFVTRNIFYFAVNVYAWLSRQ